MTRRSKREIERPVDGLTNDTEGEPLEIRIGGHRVNQDGTREFDPDYELYAYRDDAGNWHSERVDHTDGGDTGGDA